MNIQIVITRFMVGGLLLCASMCGCGEDDYNYVRIEGTIDNATIVENNSAGLQVNDTLFITTEIPFEFMDNPDFNDIRQIDGLYENDPFVFQMILTKESQFGDDVRISVAPEYIVSFEGSTVSQYQSFVLTSVEETDSFKHRFGIILREPGTYKLNSYTDNSEYLMQYNINGSSTSLSLYSVLRTGSTAPNFTFTVNP